MQQSINLYHHLDKHEPEPVSSGHIALAAAVMLAIIVLYSVFLAVDLGMKKTQLADARAMQDQLGQQLAELQANQSGASGQRQEIERLQQQLADKKIILASIESENSEDGAGFSEYLAGLGRQHLRGLWLQHIVLDEGGEEISLKGAMRKASLLPRYLQELRNEPVFQGLRFQLMRIEDKVETQGEMQFEITVIPEQQNGGEA